ncbi:5'-nucleotidase C-terminal domain-containing protein [Corynebacterium pacaense]|uniref:5'-nucleotidase C-terminal domain-containing protein n=1 Tax=Corynebacterium pacaense TaxID=1816684 RepID=UPI001FED14B9|nr:5'-nucleotidase C-terminal domain-containing protein [Corynebacterium pacaense]
MSITYDKAAKKVTRVEGHNVPAKEIAAECAGTPDAEVAGIVAAAVDSSVEEGNKVVATIDNSFYRGSDKDAGPGTNRGTESTLNNLLAEAGFWGIRETTKLGPDFGIMNAGGVREDLEKGEVTFSDAYLVQPFNNAYGVVDIKGEQVRELLEQQWKDPNSEHPRLALGLSNNVQYSYDPTAEQGKRITAIYIDGKPVDPAATYRVAGSSFLLSGGDGFSALKSGSNFTDAGVIDVDLFTRYLAEHTGVEPRTNQASVGISIKGEARPGNEVELDLSSLSYTSAGEPQAKDVTVTAGGESVTAEVDNTVVTDFDETGSATVSLRIPSDATELKIETDNGTTFTVPLDEQVSGSSSFGKFAGIAAVLAVLGGAFAFWYANVGSQLLAQFL